MTFVASQSRDGMDGRVILNQDGSFEVGVADPKFKQVIEDFLRDYYGSEKDVGLRGGGTRTEIIDGKETQVHETTLRKVKPGDDGYAGALADKFNLVANDRYTSFRIEPLSEWEHRRKES